MEMALGGVEPPHAASKAAALSAELQGPATRGGGGDSNPRPPGPQPGALPTELPPPRTGQSSPGRPMTLEGADQ